MAERALVDVEIVGKGDGNVFPTNEVQIKTTKGDTLWVPERDVIARKPNPEAKA